MSSEEKEVVLAIDPGYDRCGVAFMTKRGEKPTVLFSTCVTSQKKDEHPKRVQSIFDALKNLIQAYQPNILALETLFFSVNKSTAMRVAEVRGALFALAGIYDLPVREVSPQAIKLALTGSGNASKAQVEKMVTLTVTLPKTKRFDDEIDAIALGVTALELLRVEKRKKALAK